MIKPATKKQLNKVLSITNIKQYFFHELYVIVIIIFNPGKDSKCDVTSENWDVGFALLYQAFVDS